MHTVNLDHDRELKWTLRAQARLSSLVRPPSIADLRKPRRGFYALLAFVWASLVDVEAFASPEDLAEYFGTAEKQIAGMKALFEAVNEGSGKLSEQKNESSVSGQSPS